MSLLFLGETVRDGPDSNARDIDALHFSMEAVSKKSMAIFSLPQGMC